MKNDKDINKHGDEINDLMDKTINLYQYDYRDEAKAKLDLIIRRRMQENCGILKVLHPFFMFVLDHKENKSGRYEKKESLYIWKDNKAH